MANEFSFPIILYILILEAEPAPLFPHPTPAKMPILSLGTPFIVSLPFSMNTSPTPRDWRDDHVPSKLFLNFHIEGGNVLKSCEAELLFSTDADFESLTCPPSVPIIVA